MNGRIILSFIGGLSFLSLNRLNKMGCGRSIRLGMKSPARFITQLLCTSNAYFLIKSSRNWEVHFIFVCNAVKINTDRHYHPTFYFNIFVGVLNLMIYKILVFAGCLCENNIWFHLKKKNDISILIFAPKTYYVDL